MRKISSSELASMASAANGSIDKIYLHWSAGHYGSFFSDYHINIDSDGSVYVSCDDFTEHKNHTYMRNTGAIGIALACCADANTNDIGSEPPTNDQIENMAQVIAVLCKYLGLTCDKNTVLTHGEAANNEDGEYKHEPYACWSDPQPEDGNVRWDLEFLGTDESPKYNPFAEDGTRGGDVLRGKANYYLNNL